MFPIWEQMTNSEGSITSTGPDMYRFFFSVNDAVNLVQDTLQSIDNLGGKIISLPMKGAKIRNILDIWSELFNVPWMQSQQRFGDREYELLIAENEIRHATEIEINNRRPFSGSVSGNIISYIGSREISSPLNAVLGTSTTTILDTSDAERRHNRKHEDTRILKAVIL
ncbi:hypothetical protein EBV26_17110 [bacterium]|nr:hypothetical protein [bacterium]